jgi:uncharacterized membrane protein YphA (DoxX/SURF4 family)
LRAAVAVTAVVQGGVYLTDRGNSTFGRWLVGLLAVASGALLLLGFLTKAACALVGLSSIGIAFSWLPVPPLNLFDTKLALLLVIIIAAAIMLLGPGAFSLDAHLFGRREIIIPHAARSPKS